MIVKHYIKFFQFKFSASFTTVFKSLSTTSAASQNTYLIADSTEWLNASEFDGRRWIVHHILALITWADSRQLALAGEGGDDNGSE